MKMFGSRICPDCVEAERILHEKQVPFEYIVITENTANLKEFLKMRDTLSLFDTVKKAEGIGIPCFVIGEKITLDIDEAMRCQTASGSRKKSDQ